MRLVDVNENKSIETSAEGLLFVTSSAADGFMSARFGFYYVCLEKFFSGGWLGYLEAMLNI